MITGPVTAAEADRLFAPLRRFPRLAVAVSGGADSLALLHLMSRWAAEGADKPRLDVLTVDHALRSDSRGEAEMVARVAASFGLDHAILTWTGGSERGSSVQERARVARYDLMAAYCHAHDIGALTTAHHLDDQAETFLMRLKRGSGLDGLAAIPEESVWAGIPVLRPLLDVPKARLLPTLKEAGLTHVNDPSNADPRFERVRVRGSGEALAALGLTAEALARSARRLRRARIALEQSTDNFLAKQAAMHEAGYCLLAPDALRAAPEEIALRALARILASVGGRTEPVRLSKLEALLAGLAANPDKTHTLAGCRIAPVLAGIGIFRESRGSGLPAVDLKPGERALWDNRFRVALGEDERRGVTVRALGKDADACVEAFPWLKAVPRFARITLPACERDGALILPNFGPLVLPVTCGFQANFVGAGGVQPRGLAR